MSFIVYAREYIYGIYLDIFFATGLLPARIRMVWMGAKVRNDDVCRVGASIWISIWIARCTIVCNQVGMKSPQLVERCCIALGAPSSSSSLAI